ncbi:MAG: undecaprenyl-diphosphate phosphatase [Pseudomonadota bacterium]|nr:undecaprenyl-diphosphate phosphatase [Pseudomonadota bacterium]
MDEIIYSVFLGIIQGLTEFLPVSSSGHLVLVQELLGVNIGSGILFEVAVHIATLIAILIFYRKKLFILIQGFLKLDRGSLNYIGKLFVGTLPAVFAVLFFRSWIEDQFNSLIFVAVCLLLTGCLIWSTRFTLQNENNKEPSWFDALIIGCVQAIAILPGISRSGSTVAVAIALGINPIVAAEFSFMLGMIAMFGAGILMFPELVIASPELITNIIFAGIAALISGLLALFIFVWLLRSQRFYFFAWYLWIIGALTILLSR